MLEPDEEPAHARLPPPTGRPATGRPATGPSGHPVRPPPGAPAGRVSGPPSIGADALVDSLARAADDPDAFSLVDLDGEDRETEPIDISSAEPPATLEPVASGEPATPRNPAPHEDPPASGPGPSDDLELDLERAGLSAPPRGMSAPGDDRAKPPTPVPPSPADSAAATTPAASGSWVSRPAKEAAPGGFLRGDLTALGLGAAAISLAVGLAVGTARANKVERTVIDPLLTELNAAVDRPLAARAGKIRTSAQIKGDIEAAASDARSRFLVGWLLTAVPLAGAAFFVGRRYV